MNEGKTIFSQIMSFIPKNIFDKYVKEFKGNYRCRTFSSWDQFLCLSFAQLTYRESLRDIEVCLKTNSEKLYHIGIKGNVAKTNISRANKIRDWRIFAQLARHLINEALALYTKDELIYKELDNTLYALDSTTIDLCLSLFPWAKFRKNKSAVKIHTLLEIRTSIPTFIHVTSGRVHDVNILDLIPVEPLAIYIMDKGYTDFERLFELNNKNAFFITRAKRNLKSKRVYSHDVHKSSNIKYDQTVKLTGLKISILYPIHIREIKFIDKENDKELIFLTNNFSLTSEIISNLYKDRWKIELFFKWIKQHLRIKSFYGTTENAVKTQIWIAISIYVLIAIIKKKLNITESLYTILQILSINIFSKNYINQLLNFNTNTNETTPDANQLVLF
ncbi:MAG: IS4 family transposase [Bacteroidota bacterium]|nr:IS4 family transposase [Bacteroidota bacterium]